MGPGLCSVEASGGGKMKKSVSSIVCRRCFESLREKFGGQTVYFPMRRAPASAKEARRLRRIGLHPREIGREMQITERRVYQLLAMSQ